MAEGLAVGVVEELHAVAARQSVLLHGVAEVGAVGGSRVVAVRDGRILDGVEAADDGILFSGRQVYLAQARIFFLQTCSLQ